MKWRNLSRLSCIFVQAVGWQEVDSGARNWVDYYWLRSPMSSSSQIVFCIGASGFFGSSNSANITLCARPAFKISIN